MREEVERVEHEADGAITESTYCDIATTECLYCLHDVPDEGEYVPPMSDDKEWARLAPWHDVECEWVTTRAHRLMTAKR